MSKKRREKTKETKPNEQNRWKPWGPIYIYIYIYIDNIIKEKLYIKYKKIKINLMYKVFME